MKRFLVLDSFRGLCAVALVVHHSHIERSITELTFFRNASQFAGFFFALSGFLIYRRYVSYLSSARELRDFMIGRVCRVMPLHVAVLLFFIGFECLKLLLERYGLSLSYPAFSGDRAPREILPNLLLIQAWWPTFNALSFNYPAWLISVQFYLWLLFGCLMVALPGLARTLCLLVCAAAFVALYLDVTQIPRNVLWGAACFFAGTFTYRLYVRLRDSAPGPLVSSTLEIAILGMIGFVMTEVEGPITVELGLLFCAAILIFSHEAGIVSRLLSLRLFPALGNLWLSIYLTHAAVIFVLGSALAVASKYAGLPLLLDKPAQDSGLMTRYLSTGSTLNDNLLMLFVVVAVIVVSMLTHRYIEAPGIRFGWHWKRGTLLRRRKDDPPQTQV
ncbi:MULTISPECIES: acyltransferase [unclassified Pseudomonas]|uniref:acyltransferase family protein n=1 Tax=unclassified Pseudomonas TaxID=196821 RepID=UPI000D3A0CA7|nr:MULTISPECIES: acyltransferase [unclassified Pseudomonas]RAU44428.1 acyltransferase [Pseudomonas sp. RIT 409]RAU50925.1 acyltransferase [Pseudomonas sp. RIT 412]